MIQIEGMEWRAERACKDVDPNVFFPDHGSAEVAKAVCRTCVVKVECLEYALENRIDHGVYGETSARERRRILKTRREATTTEGEAAA